MGPQLQADLSRSLSPAALLSGDLAPAKIIARDFGVVRRTIGRWVKDAKLGFPQPLIINHRWYFRRPEVDAWKLERIRKSITEARES